MGVCGDRARGKSDCYTSGVSSWRTRTNNPGSVSNVTGQDGRLVSRRDDVRRHSEVVLENV